MIEIKAKTRELHFIDSNGRQGVCGVTRYPVSKGEVVVFTELEKNGGMSVTNAAAKIADKAIRQFGIDPRKVVAWVEHYLPDRYANIEYVWYYGQPIRPTWRHLSAEEFTQLIRRV